MPNLYISDTHLGHGNILTYCDRPFSSVGEMDGVIAHRLREAGEHGRVFHLGDLSLDPPATLRARHGGLFRDPSRHVLVAGNHDPVVRHEDAYAALFGTVVGTEESWRTNRLMVTDEVDGQSYRLLLSHQPQEYLEGADFNLYGHLHNDNQRKVECWQRRPEPDFLRPARYLNVSAELVGYRPRTLAELLQMREEGHLLL